MPALAFTDHRQDPAAWARSLGISREAVELHLSSDVIDLHIDSFIWSRALGYDLTKRHGVGLLGGRVYSQVDFPRALEAGLSGATWSITTSPLRNADSRADTLTRNVRELCDLFASVGERFAVVRDLAEYHQARSQGKHAAFLGVQGGNALEREERVLSSLVPGVLLRVTLVHLTSSRLGSTSSPLRFGRDQGLTVRGRELVERLNHERILVDLAHLSRRGFWDAVQVHDPGQPLIVSHTGVCGVHDHWRNLDDAQLYAVAETGGTVGIIYHTGFLGDSLWGGSAQSIVRHLEYVVSTVGEDHASLGSDWDGAIATPRDLPTCLQLPKLTELMLQRGFKPERVQKILGGNFLRVLAALRKPGWSADADHKADQTG